VSSRAWLLLAAAASVLLAAVLVLGEDDSGPDRPLVAQTGSADRFVDSIGVQTHLQYGDTAYARQPEVLARLRELGVRHIRDGAPVRAPALAQGLQRASRQGLRATLGGDVVKIAPAEGVLAGVRATGSRVAAFEAPNELDNFGPPDWEERLAAYLPRYRDAVRRHARRVPILGPSFVDPSYYEGVDPDTYDVANLHPYPGALPPERTLERALRRGEEVAPGKPVAFSEFGYHNALTATVGQPPASEQAAAVYLPRALLRAFALGVERTFVYELLDEKPEPALVDPEQHFGLLRQDLTPKPAFSAIRNLIQGVRTSPGRAEAEPPLPSVSADKRIHRVGLTRDDGSRVIAVWRPVSVWDRDRRTPIAPGLADVRIAWPRPARDLVVTRPSIGPDPVLRRTSTTGERLVLDGDVVLLSYR
jgi:hypothetical protein